jgi:hypothetical protein
MPLTDWRKLGLFAVIILALALVDGRLALWLTAALAAVIVISNAGTFAGLVKRVTG